MVKLQYLVDRGETAKAMKKAMIIAKRSKVFRLAAIHKIIRGAG
jgi:hypothetical protein